MNFFTDSFHGDPHGTGPKFVRITEVFSLQFFRWDWWYRWYSTQQTKGTLLLGKGGRE